MGIIQCKKHGYGSFYEMCLHMYEQYKQDNYIDYQEIPACFTKVCADCAERIKLSDISSMANFDYYDLGSVSEEEFDNRWDKVEEKYNQIDRKIVCVACYNEMRLRSARKSAFPDPFPAYEHTLLWEDKKTIDDLEECLKTKIDLPDFQEEFYKRSLSQRTALSLSPGNITKPLEIRLYYIHDTKKQQQILKVMDDFFQNVDEKQRRVTFIEKEVVIKKYLPNGVYSQQKGEENILLEVEVT